MAKDSITIQGLDFAVHSPYSAGHVLSAEEAGVLNQTFHENLRNNFAGSVKGKKDEHGDELPTNVMKELQDEFAAYADDYKFGVRRAGVRAPADPIEAEAFKMVKDLIRIKVKEQGKKADAATISEAASKILASDRGDKYRKAAEARLKEAQKVAGESLSDIINNLSADDAEEKAA